MDRNKIIWILLAIWFVSAVLFALYKSDFPTPNGGKALLRDELIRLSEPR